MPPSKDRRYKVIKSLLETKRIVSLKEVFTVIPMSILRTDMKINYSTLRKRVHNTANLTVRDFHRQGELFEVDPIEIFRMATADRFTQYRPLSINK